MIVTTNPNTPIFPKGQRHLDNYPATFYFQVWSSTPPKKMDG